MYVGVHVKYPQSFQISMKLEFSRQILEKYSNIIFQEKPSSGSRIVPCGRTDEQTDSHDEAKSLFSQFCERAYNRIRGRTCHQHSSHEHNMYQYQHYRC